MPGLRQRAGGRRSRPPVAAARRRGPHRAAGNHCGRRPRPAPGRAHLALIRDGAAGIVAVPDRALIEAMRMFAQAMKLVVEPTACLGLAAARHGGLPLRGKRVGVVVTGGNVDLPRYLALLGAADSDGVDADLLATRSS
ncbi:pyridoxal-phosphate dependent enzyme [Achromobacter xylosoxidans]